MQFQLNILAGMALMFVLSFAAPVPGRSSLSCCLQPSIPPNVLDEQVQFLPSMVLLRRQLEKPLRMATKMRILTLVKCEYQGLGTGLGMRLTVFGRR